MAPRRGGGGFSSGWGDGNPWEEETWLTLDYYPTYQKTLFLTRFAFDVLSLAAFLIFDIWACRIHNLPGKSVIWALHSWVLSQTLVVIWGALYIADTVVTKYYLIILMLFDIFWIMGICFTLHAFWGIIHSFLGHLRPSGKPPTAVPILHWIFLSIAWILGFAQFALYVISYVDLVTNKYGFIHLARARLTGAMYIVYFVLSLEILSWTIYVVVKAGRHSSVAKTPATILMCGAVCWFAVSLAWAIVYIQHGIMLTVTYQDYLDAALSVVQFVFWFGTFTGLLLCCRKWGARNNRDKYPDAQNAPLQHPTGQSAQYPPHYEGAHYEGPHHEGNYPPPQQQPYGNAPYHDYSTQHQGRGPSPIHG